MQLDKSKAEKAAEKSAQFGLVEKNCESCGAEFSTHDDRVRVCRDCYLVLQDFEDVGGEWK